MGHEFLPSVGSFSLIVESLQSSLIHELLNVFKHNGELMGKCFPLDLWFITIESYNCFNFIILDVFRTNLESDWHTFKFPMIEFPSRIVVISQIDLHSNVSLFQTFIQSISSCIDLFFFSFERNRNNDNLHISYSWRKYQAFIVSVIHSHDTDRASSETPRCLPYKFLLLLLVFEHDVEHFSEVLP